MPSLLEEIAARLGAAGAHLDQPLLAFAADADLSARQAEAIKLLTHTRSEARVSDLIRPEVDRKLQSLLGTRHYEDLVMKLADWADGLAPEASDNDEPAAAAWARRPPTPDGRRSVISHPDATGREATVPDGPPAPPQYDFDALSVWAEEQRVSAHLDDPLPDAASFTFGKLASPLSVRAALDGTAAEALREGGIPREVVRAIVARMTPYARDYMHTAARNTAWLRARAAKLPSPSAEPPPGALAKLDTLLAAVQADHAGGVPAPGLPWLPVGPRFVGDPARLMYDEGSSPESPTVLGFRPLDLVSIDLSGFEADRVRIDCRYDADAWCQHRRRAVQAARAFLRGPQSPDLNRLRTWLETPGWSRLVTRLDAELNSVAAQPAREDQRLIWRVRMAPQHGVVLDPALQKRTLRGSLSRGSRVGLDRLMRDRTLLRLPSDAEAVDLLTGGFGRFAPHSWTPPAGPTYRALLALAGAPNVFLEDRDHGNKETRNEGSKEGSNEESKKESKEASSDARKDGRRDAPVMIRTAALELHLKPDEMGEATSAGSARLVFQLGSCRLDGHALLAAAPDRRHLIALDHARNACFLARITPEVVALATAHAAHPAAIPQEAFAGMMNRLSRLQEHVELYVPPVLRGQREAVPCALVVRLVPSEDGGLEAALLTRAWDGGPVWPAGVGPQFLFREADGLRTHIERDRAQEHVQAEAIARSTGLLAGETVGPHHYRLDDVGAGLAALVALRALGDAVTLEWPKDPWTVSWARGNALKLKISEKRDWFGVDGLVTLDEGTVPLSELLAAVRRGRNWVALGDRRFALIEQSLRERLLAASDVLYDGRSGIELSHFAAPALNELVDDAAALQAVPSWHKVAARFAQARAHTPQLPTDLHATLRPYQTEGFSWLSRLGAAGAGGVLADDMGLGKTVQTLAVLLERAPQGPALVVAPTSVVPNWLAEMERFAPWKVGKEGNARKQRNARNAESMAGLRATLYRGADREEQLAKLGPRDVLVTSYAIAVRDAQALAKTHFSTLVIDEAQAVKNAATRRARALRSLDADFKLALTGTPIENHLGELWSLFRIVTPGLLGGWDQFRERFALPIERDKDAGRKAALGRILRPFLLRRTKREVAPELPAKTEINRFVDLGPEERKLYETLRGAAAASLAGLVPAPVSGRGKMTAKVTGKGTATGSSGARDPRFQILAALTRLRQLACHPALVDAKSDVPSAKMSALIELLLELKEEGHRALVFSQFRSLLRLAEPQLLAVGLRTLTLDGQTPAEDRERRVQAFQTGQADAFLISLRAGGTGLNLTEATYVIHLDPWWNPAVEDQATDRAHRIGQNRAVTVVRLVTRGTVEEAVLAMHQDKRALAAGILDGADVAGRMGTAELVALLQAGAQETAATERDDGSDEVIDAPPAPGMGP